jgi:nicotinamidase-related amidase
VLPELAPRESEVVLDKLTSSAFTSTQLDLVLRNLGVWSPGARH